MPARNRCSEISRSEIVGPPRRSGSALVITLLGCLVVLTLGLGVLITNRIERERATTGLDVYQASLNAQAGIDMGFYRIDHDPAWRVKAAAGTWDVPLAIGSGTYRFTMTDPVDGDVADSIYDPVVITATGVAGSARQILRVRLDVDRPGFECLHSSIHANGNIELNGVAAVSDHWFTAHGNIVADADGSIISEVHADVAANGNVEAKGGSTFHGATTLGLNWPLSTPDPNNVFNYYLAHGTYININDLPMWGDNLLDNPSMEGPPPDPPTTGWTAYGNAIVAPEGNKKKDGTYSLRVSNRLSPQDGAGQDITADLASGLTYEAVIYAGSVNDDKIDARLVIEWESATEGLQTWTSSWKELPVGKFVDLRSADTSGQPDSFTPTWTGSLLWARLRVVTATSLDDLRLDAASLIELTPYPTIRTIHRQVLSPDHNPFGVGQTNAEGIYVIDCQGGLVSIQRSRIVGTLVVLNPHSAGTFIWSVVNWAPAVSNYPAILSNGIVNFWLANDLASELEEGPANVNYNPFGASFNAGWDTDKDDTYGSLMRGIVYSTDDIKLKYRPVLEGVLVSDASVVSESTDLLGQTEFDVTYLSHYAKEAPPGFSLPPVIRIAPGSFNRVVP